MSYSPITIAKRFAQIAAERGHQPLTHMQLQKLTYIAHGYKLAMSQANGFHDPLITEDVNAWKFGPVIPELYHFLKAWGGQGVPTQVFSSDNGIVNPLDDQLIQAVYQAYGEKSGVELSTLTHMPGTPWAQVWNNGGSYQNGAIIPDHLIQAYYSNFLRCSNRIEPMAVGA
ncbi:TPA: DUF4065 domain-containing protein [Vibrio parahaemolyticus]|nr:DUF4065 domain-containing protein [Vibrio parahaemolyticus]